ncbi:phage tail assembly chaperone GT [Staphylococcus xylosus]
MKKIAYQMMVENGKDINEILDLPFSFLMEIIEDHNKPRKTESLVAAFGG